MGVTIGDFIGCEIAAGAPRRRKMGGARLGWPPMTGRPRYKPHPARRLRAFFLTDRMGHTLASTLGFFAVLRWWVKHRLSRDK